MTKPEVSTRERLIKKIEEAKITLNLSGESVCRRAADNSRIYQRLLDGGDVTTEKADQIFSWIEEKVNQQPEKEHANG